MKSFISWRKRTEIEEFRRATGNCCTRRCRQKQQFSDQAVPLQILIWWSWNRSKRRRKHLNFLQQTNHANNTNTEFSAQLTGSCFLNAAHLRYFAFSIQKGQLGQAIIPQLNQKESEKFKNRVTHIKCPAIRNVIFTPKMSSFKDVRSADGFELCKKTTQINSKLRSHQVLNDIRQSQ